MNTYAADSKRLESKRKHSTEPYHQSTSRPCDNQLCHICLKAILFTDKGCISTVPTDRLKKLKTKTVESFKIKWDLTLKSNAFHYECWNKLKNSSSLANVERNTMNTIEDTVEIYESNTVIFAMINDFVAPLFRETSHQICFTGAGISATSGIPTYRGAEGIDTLDEHAKKLKKVDVDLVDEEEEDLGTDYTLLQPSFSHKALVALKEHNLMHFVITQNCDNLHVKAGFPRSSTVDLHGNIFVEWCEKCSTEYERDFEVDVYSTDCKSEDYAVECSFCSWNHYTGRVCSKKGCKGKLRDSIVNFGDDLHDKVLGGLPLAEQESKKADVFLAIGSSLTVHPACNLIKNAKKSVIVNPQETDFDDMCTHRLWTTSDIFFEILLQALEISE